MRYLLLTDIPAPWREKVYEKVYEKLGNDFHVAYCNYNEKRRLWEFPPGKYPKTFLKGITISTERTKENYINVGVIPFLLRHRPKVLICFSLNPTIFLAFMTAIGLRRKIGVFADTWLGRDRNISLLQSLARRVAYGFVPCAYVGASKQTLKMYRFYNNAVKDEQLFLSSLCADNEYFRKVIDGREVERKYEMMFSGRIVESKNPLFFARVATKVKEIKGSCSVLVMGDGDERLKREMFKIFEENGVQYNFSGFIKHDELPLYYSQAKLLLLPTTGDCWGVVINEAFVSGVPVLTTNMTGAAGELVLDGNNGFILPMDADLWAARIVRLLTNKQELREFAECAKRAVSNFRFEKAAEGITEAFCYLDEKCM